MTPDLSTSRLTLREFRSNDVHAYHKLESDPDVVRYQFHHPRTLEESKSLVEDSIRDQTTSPRKTIELAVELCGTSAESNRASDKVDRQSSPTQHIRNQASSAEELGDAPNEEMKFIGRIGCQISGAPQRAMLWYAFLPEEQGKGFATEAMTEFLRYLDSITASKKNDDATASSEYFETYEIECDPRNVGSRRIAKKLGFVKVEEVERAFECKGEVVGSVVYRCPVGSMNLK